MSENQAVQQETVAPVKAAEPTLGESIKPAFFTWLKTIFYFIVLPYKIWKTTTIRLGKLSGGNGKAIIKDGEEFPMYTFNRVSIDASIFILGILSVPLVFVGVGFFLYLIMIPMLSFLNEILNMSLVTNQKLSKIVENTDK